MEIILDSKDLLDLLEKALEERFANNYFYWEDIEFINERGGGVALKLIDVKSHV